MALAAGGNPDGGHSCGIRPDQTAICWGNNSDGQTDVPDGNYTSIAPGGRHTCGLRTDQTTICWGSNEEGQLDVPDALYTAIAASGALSCGLKTDQTIICWGEKYYDDSDDDDGTLESSDGLYTDVSAGWQHACGLKTDQTIICWGADYSNQTDAPDGPFHRNLWRWSSDLRVADRPSHHLLGQQISGARESTRRRVPRYERPRRACLRDTHQRNNRLLGGLALQNSRKITKLGRNLRQCPDLASL